MILHKILSLIHQLLIIYFSKSVGGGGLVPLVLVTIRLGVD